MGEPGVRSLSEGIKHCIWKGSCEMRIRCAACARKRRTMGGGNGKRMHGV
jgi:hypothetical protein